MILRLKKTINKLIQFWVKNWNQKEKMKFEIALRVYQMITKKILDFKKLFNLIIQKK